MGGSKSVRWDKNVKRTGGEPYRLIQKHIAKITNNL